MTLPSRPDETLGESTAWYASFWPFCAACLNHLKGDDWCLSPEQSIALHTENMTVPKQLLVRAAKARNNVTALPYGTPLLDIRFESPPANLLKCVSNRAALEEVSTRQNIKPFASFLGALVQAALEGKAGMDV